MHITVFGATRNTGKSFVEQAIAKGGIDITILVRTPENLTYTEEQLENVTVVKGNALVKEDVAKAIANADVILFTLGAKFNGLNTPPDAGIESEATPIVLDAIKETRADNPPRFIMVSSTGAGNYYDVPNDITKVNDYVVVTNTASAYIYGLATHKQLDLSVCPEKRFFGEVFLHLTKRKVRPNVKAEIQEYRRVIRKHLDAYKEAAGITEFDIANPNQTAQFEAARIYTAYMNNIQTKFGHTVLPVITVGDKNIGDMLEPVLTTYDNDYKFAEEGIYYNIKAHPKKHFIAFYCLAVLLEMNGYSGSGLTAPVASVATNSPLEDQPRKPRKPRKREKPGEKKLGEFTYIHELLPEQLANMENPIFMDPGCQDTVFGMTEESTSEEKALFRYTRSQKAKETRTTHYRKLREKGKKAHPDSNEIKAAEARLAAFSCTSILPGKYEQYVRTRAAVWPVLSKFYTNAMTTSKNRNNPQPIHRKLRQSAHIKQQQADEQLAKSIRATCDDETSTAILGNWSVPMARYHEFIRGVGFRRMLRKKGCQVYLIDEFRTSKTCPNCLTGALEKFLKVPNPRPYQRKKMKEILCHGLLKCTNELCMGPVEVDGVLAPRSHMYS
ncbi:hypothetical protein IW138_006246 [Coemansia sp. RSA 986]|nr:hypothetical protein IW138_006246 [Coemansia sp. RSA 986]